MKKINVGLAIVAAVMVAGAVYASSVSSFSTPELVSEINTVITSVEGRIAAVEAAGVGGALASAKIIVGNSGGTGEAQTVTGDITLSNAGVVAIGANKVVESMLKAVDTASDEDFLSYESTTGDFEWHSAAEILAKFAGVPVAPAVSPSVNSLTNTVTITNKDTAGSTLVAKRLIRVWVSEATGGVPSTNNIESIEVTSGTQIQAVTAAADVYALTTAGGTASVKVIGTAAGTNYVNVADGGFVTSAAIVFEAE